MPMETPTLTCPRCGYDLSGAAATWTETCPLRQTCSECGLVIELRYLLNPVLVRELKFFEVAPRRRIAALRATVRRALRPWAFWNWVRMEYEVSAGRLLAGAAVGMVLMHIAASIVSILIIASATLLDFAAMPIYGSTDYILGELSYRAQAVVMPWSNFDEMGPGRWGLGQLNAVSVFAMLGFFTAVILPAAYLVLPDTLRRARVRRVHLLRIAGWGMVGLPLAAHLPGAIKGVLWNVVDVFGLMGVECPGPLRWLRQSFEVHAPGQIFLVVVGWLMLWWGFACGRYLRLSRPWLVAATLLFMSALAAVIAGLLLPGFSFFIAL